jgi:tRNA A-37 threonylcarbamoyl transferase component Bud32
VKDNMMTRDFKTKQYRAVFSQGFCHQQEADFLAWLEPTKVQGEVLKDDRKARLIRCQYDGKDVVVKHYRYVNWLYAVTHALLQSRAQYAWHASLKMAAMHIPTPRALACIERISHGIVRESYFVYEYEPGFLFRDYAWSTPVDTILSQAHLHDVYGVLRGLKENRISHGDLKMPNIVVTEHGPVLIDLDQVRFHRSKRVFSKRRLRDLRRFRRELPWNLKQASGGRASEVRDQGPRVS